MAGTTITPSAATVAGPEPEIAAKKQETMTHTMASPPLIWPTQASASLISFSDIPAFSIIFPAKMKKGIASNTNLLVDADTIMGRLLITVSSGLPAPWAIMATTLEVPRHTAMGAPMRSSTAKLIKRIAATTICLPPLRDFS